ncbi:hypothetical protein FPOAC2_11004 [Fusarium poae]
MTAPRTLLQRAYTELSLTRMAAIDLDVPPAIISPIFQCTFGKSCIASAGLLADRIVIVTSDLNRHDQVMLTGELPWLPRLSRDERIKTRCPELSIRKISSVFSDATGSPLKTSQAGLDMALHRHRQYVTHFSLKEMTCRGSKLGLLLMSYLHQSGARAPTQDTCQI